MEKFPHFSRNKAFLHGLFLLNCSMREVKEKFFRRKESFSNGATRKDTYLERATVTKREN